MVRIGVTGHMNLTADTAVLVSEALHAYLRQVGGDIIGVSCIARGADSLFAEAVLEAGGTLEVILPSRDYREAKVKPDHADLFDRLLGKAARVRTMPFDHANREAYVAANEAMLGSVDELVAIWDGAPATGRGGTADVVAEARERGVPVTVIWPEGSARD
ncbi:hypothetical protein GCM10010116_38320 [Microbispora rosea subsp. aerata]|nr:hypothetical protein [Microbispora rosea]GGO19022.1 hypothetical protein GCM10010116_38320 [Microbispora rosea subsp. aerata]GIH54270.1 hypothetical protein Mro02_11840 [Microbispora rosea subsp. aerata]GLJ81551.1 hypothetical protein GCM10017588_02750 [Microbispora rosea subsp. aerata]